MKNEVSKMIKRILKRKNQSEPAKPVDVGQLVADLANAEKTIDSAYLVKSDSLRKLEQVMNDRKVDVLVVPANPDSTDVFVVYNYHSAHGVGLIQLARVKVESL
jgi:hypothetical protein